MDRKRFVSALLLIIFISVPIMGYPAGWVDDWLDQKTGQGAGYFEGQKRGYASGGTFSARVYNGGNEPLISASPPKIKAGCGGIDIFGGGLSFVNFDYLVGQMEHMVANAPMVAFDIAFNVLCESCAKAVKSAKVITDGLNGLQFDSCQASKVMVANLYKGGGGQNAAIRAEADADFSLGTGAKTLYNDVVKDWKTNPVQTASQEAAKVEQCPTPLKDLYFSPGQTILAKLGAKHGYDTTYIDLIRGFIGDLSLIKKVEGGKEVLRTIYIPPCSENKIDSADGLFFGKAMIRPGDGGACKLLSGSQNMSRWAFEKLNKITTTMRKKGALSGSDKSFLDSIPLPMYSGLKLAVNTENNMALLMPLSEITARAYANAIMLDIYNAILTMLQTAHEIDRNHSDPSARCQSDLSLPMSTELESMAERAHLGLTSIHNSYAAALKESQIVMEVTRRYEDFDRISRESLTKIVHSRR